MDFLRKFTDKKCAVQKKQSDQLKFMKTFFDKKVETLNKQLEKPKAEIAVLTDMLRQSRKTLDKAEKKFEAIPLKSPEQIELEKTVKQLDFMKRFTNMKIAA